MQSKKLGLGKLFSIVVHSISVRQLQLLYLGPGLLFSNPWRSITMAHLSPLVSGRQWRVPTTGASPFKCLPLAPVPLVLESCSITVPPQSSLFDIVQMLEHVVRTQQSSGCAHIVIQTESGLLSVTAFPTPSMPARLRPDSATKGHQN